MVERKRPDIVRIGQLGIDNTRHSGARARVAKLPTAKAKVVFLKVYRECGIVGPAAEAAHVSRQTIYVWREHDEEFAVAMNAAREEALDAIEHEAYRRAVLGVPQERPITARGEVIGTYTITEYSDRLLELVLKANRPEKYRERFDVTSDGQPLVKAYVGVDINAV
jgi:hypothetical protein